MRKPFSTCQICKAAGLKFLFNANGFSIVQCPSCHHAQVSECPTDEELSLYYSKNFGSSQTEADTESYFKNYTPDFPFRVVQTLGLDPRTTAVLDYGASYGYDLGTFQRAGFVSLAGIELSTPARTLAKRFGLHLYETLASLRTESPHACYDFIYLKHNLEHLPDPAQHLKELLEILSPGGYLLLGIPHRRSILGSLYRNRWEWMSPPGHLHYFSKQSLALLVQGLNLECCFVKSRRGHAQAFFTHALHHLPGAGRMAGLQKTLEKPSQWLSRPIDWILDPLRETFDLGEELWILARKPLAIDTSPITRRSVE